MEEQAEEADKLSIWDINRFYEDFFGMTDASIVVVGDFELNGVKNVIVKQFSNWPSKKTYIPWIEPSCADLNASDIQMKVPGTTGVNYAFYLPMHLDGQEGYISENLISLIGQIAEARKGSIFTFNRLNHCGIQIEPKQDCGNCESMAVKDIISSVKTELNNLKLNPVTQDEVSVHMRDLLRWWGDEDGLKRLLIESFDDGRTLKKVAMREHHPRTITAEQVNEVIKKYLNTDQLIVIQAGNTK